MRVYSSMRTPGGSRVYHLHIRRRKIDVGVREQFFIDEKNLKNDAIVANVKFTIDNR